MAAAAAHRINKLRFISEIIIASNGGEESLGLSLKNHALHALPINAQTTVSSNIIWFLTGFCLQYYVVISIN
jgi:hypothetical protein